MCGIAGIFNYADRDRPVDRDLLADMTSRLAHRGPDGEGLFIDGSIGLGHRRLAIVDLSPTGAQPMHTPDGRFAITYNGEFYNHAEFRPRLEARGHRFRGTSDTETLLTMMAEYGPHALADAAGIFGLGLWDRAADRLILARDPLGVKPLYYWDDGRRILFASEVKAILACRDVPRSLDREGLNDYLHFHTPLFERTFFEGISQVRAGEYLEVTRHGARARRYAPVEGFEPDAVSADARIDQLRDMLRSVVSDQLMSDVPVGTFFSGGIDSSAVATFATQAGRPIRCFGIHFSGQGVIDERPYQEAAAKAIGLELDLTTVDQSEFPADLMGLIRAQDYPVIGAAMIPMFHVSRLAAQHVKVCLGGQGADEIFAGYARYALASPFQVLTSWFSRADSPPQGANGSGARVGGNLAKQLASVRNLRRLGRSANPLRGWSGRYFDNFAHVPEARWKAVFGDGVSRARAREGFESVLAGSPAVLPADKLLDWDRQTYLTGLFHQDDRMSMANSLESRVPIADPRVVRFAQHTPFALKLRGGATKWILRQALTDTLPEWVLNRRKVGFDTPVEAWMRGPQHGFVRDLLLSRTARTRGYWNADAVERALDDQASPHWFDIVWKLAAVEAWAVAYLDGDRARVR